MGKRRGMSRREREAAHSELLRQLDKWDACPLRDGHIRREKDDPAIGTRCGECGFPIGVGGKDIFDPTSYA